MMAENLKERKKINSIDKVYIANIPSNPII